MRPGTSFPSRRIRTRGAFPSGACSINSRSVSPSFIPIENTGTRPARVTPRSNKVSVVFSTPNVPGALYKCLSVFALRDIDLSKMESRPLRGRPWEYFFYLDFIGNVREERCRNALAHLGEIANFLRVLGCYESAKR